MQTGANNPFDQRKASVLKDLLSGISDKSPKGSIDAPIVDMCNFINELPDVYTTSSCSGRIVVFKDGALSKSGEWLVADHDFVTEHQIFDAIAATLPEDQIHLLDGYTSATSSTSITKQSTYIPIKSHSPNAINLEASVCNVHFRFEAFILAVETRTLEVASAFLTLAHQCGYRESGISAVAKRYIVNVRGSLRLDVPIILDSKLLVAPTYIQMLVQMGNEKMQRNFDKINRFYSMLKENVASLHVASNGAVPTSLLNSHTGSDADTGAVDRVKAVVTTRNTAQTTTTAPETSVWSVLSSPNSSSSSPSSFGLPSALPRYSLVNGPIVLCVPRTHTKQWKDALKAANCFAKRSIVAQTGRMQLSQVLRDVYGVDAGATNTSVTAPATDVDSSPSVRIPVPHHSSPISLPATHFSLIPIPVSSQPAFITLLDHLYNHSSTLTPLTHVDIRAYVPLVAGEELGAMMGVESMCLVLPETVANAAVAATTATDQAEAKAKVNGKVATATTVAAEGVVVMSDDHNPKSETYTGVVCGEDSERGVDAQQVVNKLTIEHSHSHSSRLPSLHTAPHLPLQDMASSHSGANVAYCAVTLRRHTKAVKDALQLCGRFPKRGQVLSLAEEDKKSLRAEILRMASLQYAMGEGEGDDRHKAKEGDSSVSPLASTTAATTTDTSAGAAMLSWADVMASEPCSVFPLLSSSTSSLPKSEQLTKPGLVEWDVANGTKVSCMVISQSVLGHTFMASQLKESLVIGADDRNNGNHATELRNRPALEKKSAKEDVFSGKNKPTTPHLQWAALITTSIATVPPSSPSPPSPYASTSSSSLCAATQHRILALLASILPKRWELLGGCVLLPVDSFTHPLWARVMGAREWAWLNGKLLRGGAGERQGDADDGSVDACNGTGADAGRCVDTSVNSRDVTAGDGGHTALMSLASSSTDTTPTDSGASGVCRIEALDEATLAGIPLGSILPLSTICRHLCSVIGARVVAVQQPVHSDIMRASQAVVVYKDEDVKEDELVERLVKGAKGGQKNDVHGQQASQSVQNTSTKDVLFPENEEMMTDTSKIPNPGSVKKRLRTSAPQQRRILQDIRVVDKTLLVGTTSITKYGCWVKHRENGLWYVLDVTKSMFSSGNTTEKARAAKYSQIYPCVRPRDASHISVSSTTLPSPTCGERVLDLYSGIGYFTLPMSTHGHAGHVFACELNPYSNTALRHAATLNDEYHARQCGGRQDGESRGVADNDPTCLVPSSSPPLSTRQRITLLPGDNRRACIPLLTRNAVHRVSLGLIPHANDGWMTALIALKPQGGVLHVHANVEKHQENAWPEQVLIPGLLARIKAMEVIAGVGVADIGDVPLAGVDISTGKNSLGEHVFSVEQFKALVKEYQMQMEKENGGNCGAGVVVKTGGDVDALTRRVLYDVAIPCDATNTCPVDMTPTPYAALPPSLLSSSSSWSADSPPTENVSATTTTMHPLADVKTFAHVPIGTGPLWHPRKKDWEFTVLHVEIVKSYGPRISHVVIDIGVKEKGQEGRWGVDDL